MASFFKNHKVRAIRNWIRFMSWFIILHIYTLDGMEIESVDCMRDFVVSIVEISFSYEQLCVQS